LKCTDFKKVILPKFGFEDTPIRFKESVGIDTETLAGQPFLIADSFGRTLVPKDLWDLLEFLTWRKYEGKICWFWNKRYDFEGAISFLNEHDLRELYREGKTRYGIFKISYIPDKFFRISIPRSRGHRSFTFYDLAQFYSDHLDNVARRLLGKSKAPIDYDRLENDPDYVVENFANIQEACVQHATITKELGDLLIQKLIKHRIPISRPYSKAYLAQRFFINECFIPFTRDRKILEMGFDAYAGGWFEVFKRGHFDRLYEYDINSAYPYEISKLIGIDLGKWVFKKDLDLEATYGFIKCRINLNRSPHPIRFKFDGENFYPLGKWDTTITLDEARFILDHEIGSIEVKRACYYYPNTIKHPFNWAVRNLYEKRRSASDPTENYLLKIVLNSIYGKFFQLNPSRKDEGRWQGGKLFNPIYASIITANVRLRILRAIVDDPDKAVGVHTDSVLSMEPLDIRLGDDLGDFQLKHKGEGIVLGSGIYQILGQKRACRGFTRSLDLLELIERYPEADKFSIPQHRPIHLGEIITHSRKFTIDDLNRIETIPKVLDINFDRKRFWLGMFRRARDLLRVSHDSRPLFTNLFKGWWMT
jgi:hypothetical protein